MPIVVETIHNLKSNDGAIALQPFGHPTAGAAPLGQSPTVPALAQDADVRQSLAIKIPA